MSVSASPQICGLCRDLHLPRLALRPPKKRVSKPVQIRPPRRLQTNLVVVGGYLRRLLDNARVVRFLSQNHREILAEFQKLVEAKSLGDAVPVE